MIECMPLAITDTISTRLIVCGIAILFGGAFIFTGVQNIRSQGAEESGRRRAVLKLLGKNATYQGRLAVAVGISRVVIGVAAIVFGIVFLFVGPFLAK